MIPNPLTKVEMLKRLQAEVESAVENAWLFPQRGTVAGFLGTAPVVIVGRRPSMGSFAAVDANALYYEILAENGLANAHLTNYIKSRGEKGAADPADLETHERFLERELEIVGGHQGVVTMGDAYEPVSRFLAKRGLKVIAKLPQYASMNYGEQNIAKFRQEMAALAAIARERGWI